MRTVIPLSLLTRYIIFPYGHRILYAAILLAVTYHIVKTPTEVTVTRGTDGINQRNRRRVTMTANMQTLIRETMITRESCSRCDDTFSKIGQRLTCLKGRTRRILSLNTTVQERFPRIMREPLVHLTAVSTHQTSWIVRRRRNHREPMMPDYCIFRDFVFVAVRGCVSGSLDAFG